MSATLRHVVMHLCDDCLNGESGQCHVPGCALWMKTAPDGPFSGWREIPPPAAQDGAA